MGHPYASDEFMQFMEMVWNLRDTTTTVPAWRRGTIRALDGATRKFIMQLPPQVRRKSNEHP